MQEHAIYFSWKIQFYFCDRYLDTHWPVVDLFCPDYFFFIGVRLHHVLALSVVDNVLEPPVVSTKEDKGICYFSDKPWHSNKKKEHIVIGSESR